MLSVISHVGSYPGPPPLALNRLHFSAPGVALRPSEAQEFPSTLLVASSCTSWLATRAAARYRGVVTAKYKKLMRKMHDQAYC